MRSDRAVEVLGEDGARVFVLKVAGIPVFPPHADPGGDCVLARVLARWPERGFGWPSGFEGGIAHRVDTATSGVLLLARGPADLPALRAEFASGGLRKFYVFRSSAAGAVEMTMEAPIAHHRRRADRMVVQRDGGRTAHRGKWYPAWTRFRPLGEGLWEAEIRTGVMHQVRVHAQAAGIPLDGDPIYGASHGGSGGASGTFLLHHREMWGPGWRSPVAEVRCQVSALRT